MGSGGNRWGPWGEEGVVFFSRAPPGYSPRISEKIGTTSPIQPQKSQECYLTPLNPLKGGYPSIPKGVP
jgi:hypothetical protein